MGNYLNEDVEDMEINREGHEWGEVAWGCLRHNARQSPD